jgi:hypothetical protein
MRSSFAFSGAGVNRSFWGGSYTTGNVNQYFPKHNTETNAAREGDPRKTCTLDRGLRLVTMTGSAADRRAQRPHLSPEQKRERVGTYLRVLAARLTSIKDEDLGQDKLIEMVLLFVKSYRSALCPDTAHLPVEYLANLLGNGMLDKENGVFYMKRLSRFLLSLHYDGILILETHLKFWRDQAFPDHVQAIAEAVAARRGCAPSDVNVQAIHRSIRYLKRLGLLRRRGIRKTDQEFNRKTALANPKGTELTPVGRLLLRYIGITESGVLSADREESGIRRVVYLHLTARTLGLLAM